MADDQIVHILQQGFPRCQFIYARPKDWPAGHWFARPDRVEDATCLGCITHFLTEYCKSDKWNDSTYTLVCRYLEQFSLLGGTRPGQTGNSLREKLIQGRIDYQIRCSKRI